MKAGKYLLILLAIMAAILLGRELGGYVPLFADRVAELGPWGPVVFIAGYALATVALVPGSILTLVAGAIFGLTAGTLYVFIAAVLGSTAAFLIARYAARPLVERRIAGSRRVDAIDRAIGEGGWRVVGLLRLSPILPYNALNYTLGLTRVRLRDYLIASVGMLPGTFLYVYSGKVAGEIAAAAAGAEVQRGAGYYVVLGLGLAATVAVVVLVTRRAERVLSESTEVDPT